MEFELTLIKHCVIIQLCTKIARNNCAKLTNIVVRTTVELPTLVGETFAGGLFMPQYMDLSIYDENRINEVMLALASDVRREILRLVNRSSCNISEIARALDIPQSTAQFHVSRLEAAGLVLVQNQSSQQGSPKIISRKYDKININCVDVFDSDQIITHVMEIPIGSYSDCDVSASCGMNSETGMIEIDDEPSTFYSPAHYNAQIIWFAAGYLEYRIPNYVLRNKRPVEVAFSLELCSEAPNYRNDWKSDITFWINGVEICTWQSPGDFGGRRGLLNPDCWTDFSTQYGLLKTIYINSEGTHIDEDLVSPVAIEDLHVNEEKFFTLRIGIKPDAAHVGGINLFGKKYGNYPQDIILKLSYQEKS